MRENWPVAFKRVLRSEGGYVHDRKDRGGETNLGVTRAAWGAYLGRPVRDGEMRELTAAIVEPFYKSQYWDKVRGDELPSGIDYLVFDFAVNAGPTRAVRFLQRALDVPADGVLGPRTMAMATSADPIQVIERFSETKEQFYLGIARVAPSQGRFLKGWLARVDTVRDTVRTMVA